ncbi:MAG: nitrous oxide reductase accessory protein NosL [Ignavibacterium sp.]|nr:nitrous oxide reductase accessory protein NosL [Ignavibacterium sp.]
MKKNILLLLILLMFVACGNDPEPIIFGEDNCAHCKMMITDEQFGAELVTDKGKIYKYDSIECLLEQLHKNTFRDDQIGSMWVVDFSNPRTLIDAKTAYYTKNDDFRSPMGLNVQAFGDFGDFEKFFNDNDGKKLTWTDLVKFAGTMH